MTASTQDCASELLEVVPLVMRAMRTEVRGHRAPELSLPQFRTLAFLGRNEGAMLSDVANFLGLTPPSASKLVDGLVALRYVNRRQDREDRRRVSLALSALGSTRYERIQSEARAFLSQKVSVLSASERRHLLAAMEILRGLFEPLTSSELAARA